MKVGIRVECSTCGRKKKPIGRSAPLGTYLCDDDCPGYRQEPYVGDLWPNETEVEFGYPIGPHGVEEVNA